MKEEGSSATRELSALKFNLTSRIEGKRIEKGKWIVQSMFGLEP